MDEVLCLEPALFVDNSLAVKYSCGICKKVSYPPLTSECDSHKPLVFGKECINNYLKENNNLCPINNHKNPIIKNNSFIQKTINYLKIKCPNSTLSENMTNEGSIDNYCNWIGIIKDLNNHLKDCKYEKVKCKFYSLFGCNEIIRNKDLNQHKKLFLEKHLNIIKNTCINNRYKNNALKNENNNLKKQIKILKEKINEIEIKIDSISKLTQEDELKYDNQIKENDEKISKKEKLNLIVVNNSPTDDETDIAANLLDSSKSRYSSLIKTSSNSTAYVIFGCIDNIYQLISLKYRKYNNSGNSLKKFKLEISKDWTNNNSWIQIKPSTINVQQGKREDWIDVNQILFLDNKNSWNKINGFKFIRITFLENYSQDLTGKYPKFLIAGEFILNGNRIINMNKTYKAVNKLKLTAVWSSKPANIHQNDKNLLDSTNSCYTTSISDNSDETAFVIFSSCFRIHSLKSVKYRKYGNALNGIKTYKIEILKDFKNYLNNNSWIPIKPYKINVPLGIKHNWIEANQILFLDNNFYNWSQINGFSNIRITFLENYTNKPEGIFPKFCVQGEFIFEGILTNDRTLN